MQCGGDTTGRAGDGWSFRLLDGSNLLACTAKLTIIDLQTGAKLRSESFSQAQLESGQARGTLEAQRIYRIDFLRTPTNVPFTVELTVGGRTFSDPCPGGPTLPWTIFVS